uniref:pantoate--beta-alanine ligase n=1 Tax=Glaciimonas immobilis TaxID=728004 RepID=UPI0035D462EB
MLHHKLMQRACTLHYFCHIRKIRLRAHIVANLTQANDQFRIFNFIQWVATIGHLHTGHQRLINTAVRNRLKSAVCIFTDKVDGLIADVTQIL